MKTKTVAPMPDPWKWKFNETAQTTNFLDFITLWKWSKLDQIFPNANAFFSIEKIWGIKWFSPNIFFFINTILQHHLHVTFHLLSVLSNNDGGWREMFTCVSYPHYIVYSVYVHMCLKVSGEMAHYAIQFMVSPN